MVKPQLGHDQVVSEYRWSQLRAGFTVLTLQIIVCGVAPMTGSVVMMMSI